MTDPTPLRDAIELVKRELGGRWVDGPTDDTAPRNGACDYAFMQQVLFDTYHREP